MDIVYLGVFYRPMRTFLTALILILIGFVSVQFISASPSKEELQSYFKAAHIFQYGIGIEKDMKQAMMWYERAADGGLPEAQYNLGVLLSTGSGSKDITRATELFLKAAKQGLPEAQYNLANMYRQGEGLFQDYKEAVKWYTKSADQGYALAAFNLGAMYGNGEGVPQNYAEAAYWLSIAEIGGYTEAYQHRQKFEQDLPRIERQRIQSLVNERIAKAKDPSMKRDEE